MTTIQIVVPDMDLITDDDIDLIRSAGVGDVELVEQGARSSWLSVGYQGGVASYMGDLVDSLRQADHDRNYVIPTTEKLYYDIEVYPNLFVVCWKAKGTPTVYYAVNPSPQLVNELIKQPLVGFNNRKYDNHIMAAAAQGDRGDALYGRSQALISDDNLAGTIPSAYTIGYTDVYDYANMGNKKSLKEWEIDLDLVHDEMDIPWDQPVPEHLIPRVVEYCQNDVRATEAVDEHLTGDWAARKLLCDLTGLPPITSTNALSARFVFGPLDKAKAPWKYTDLTNDFPGYEWRYETKVKKKRGVPTEVTECVSTYRGLDPSEGGYVFTRPGIWYNVALLDVESLHPTSLIEMNCFEKYTERFRQIRDGRLFIKHLSAKDEVTEADVEAGSKFLDGALAPYIRQGRKVLKDLANALKIVINSVYGQTSAKHPNYFNGNSRGRSKNPDNIVAKRGALFMIDLQKFCEERGWTVVHIKTDSIKLAEATPEMIQAVTEFGKRYGYTFQHEATYDRMVLLDKAQYAAHDESGWHFTGEKFLHPYVSKRVFFNETPTLKDTFEKKSVSGSGAMYLGDRHVGRVGLFAPVKDGSPLFRVDAEKRGAVSGTKGWSWALAKDVMSDTDIDYGYPESLVSELRKRINRYGDIDEFVAGTRKEDA